jgi:hypothetical protein
MRSLLTTAALLQVLAVAGTAAAQGIDTGELPPACKAEEDEALRKCNIEVLGCVGAAMAEAAMRADMVDAAVETGKCFLDAKICLDDVAARSAECEAEVQAEVDRRNEVPRPPCPAFEVPGFPDCE